jgi:hypothetical protein
MNPRSALEYTMFAPAQLLRIWREQRPSNIDNFNWSVQHRKVHYMEKEIASDFIFELWYVIFGTEF